ncbi:hypothetical protein D3C75_1075730 [compost metagenome]
MLKDFVHRRVVTVLDGGGAELGQGHPGIQVFFGDRVVVDQIGLLDFHPLSQKIFIRLALF